MTREEIKDKLTSSGMIDRFDRDNDLWREAFKTYNLIHQTKMDLGCSKCVNTVWEWVKR